jgi:hypothetical protein
MSKFRTYTVEELAQHEGWSVSSVYKKCSGQKDRHGKKMQFSDKYRAKKVKGIWTIEKLDQVVYSETNNFVNGLKSWMKLDTARPIAMIDKSLLWDKRQIPVNFPAMKRERDRLEKVRSPLLSDGDALLKILCHCHQMANEGKTVKLEVTFSSDGTWRSNLTEPNDEPCFASLVQGNSSTRKIINRWLGDIEDKLNGTSFDGKSYEHDKPFCWRCGTALKKRDRKFCAGSQCKKRYDDWLSRLAETTPRRRALAITRELHRLNWFNKHID